MASNERYTLSPTFSRYNLFDDSRVFTHAMETSLVVFFTDLDGIGS